MNRSWTYRVFALTMAFLVGVSSVSWAVVEHYCQGALHNISLIVDTGSCHDTHASDREEETCKSVCSSRKGDHRDCCTDEVDLLDHDSTVIIPSDDDVDPSDIKVLNFSFDDRVHWPMAKINPVRGPCSEVLLLTLPEFAQLQSWLL